MSSLNKIAWPELFLNEKAACDFVNHFEARVHAKNWYTFEAGGEPLSFSFPTIPISLSSWPFFLCRVSRKQFNCHSAVVSSLVAIEINYELDVWMREWILNENPGIAPETREILSFSNDDDNAVGLSIVFECRSRDGGLEFKTQCSDLSAR